MMTKVKGIDVSKWQGDIDWAKVKSAGIKFAMIRLGYGSSDGKSCGIDAYFAKNVASAIEVGIDVGCYFYSYATSVTAAKKEAEFVVGILNKYKGVFTYPVAYDIEDKSQKNLGNTKLANMIVSFGEIIEKAGYYCSIYSSLDWWKNYLDSTKLSRFDHWLAQWAAIPTYTGTYGMWQYSSSGTVAGITGRTDMDIAYKDYPKIIRNNKLNGFTSSTQKASIPTTATETEFKVGDIVNFNGSTQYAKANAILGTKCAGGQARITQIYQLGTSKHPYHLIHTGIGCTVYGWVDKGTFTKV